MTDNIVVEQEEYTGEDYVDINEDTTNHDIEDESQVENDEVVESESTLPDKFKDKTIEEIVNSYTNLEKEFGRKNNELGEQRKLIDQLLELQLEEKQSKSDKLEAQKVDVDSLLEDPDRVISEAVANNPTLKSLQEQQIMAVRERDKAGFEAKHNDWQDVVASQEFSDWIVSSPVRTAMFQDANTNYKYDVADELLSLYKSVQATTAVQKEQAKEAQKEHAKKVIKDAATEKGATNASTKKIYRRSDLINLRIRDPERWAAMQDEIMLAYAEKRVR